MSTGARKARDHPRACGENRVSGIPSICELGSPPRMRGKPNLAIDQICLSGITPAHAGKTCYHVLIHCCFRDHPRACGENSTLLRKLGGKWGSPPRMRGKRHPAHYKADNAGITPAHAGKTCWRLRRAWAWRDHPRACGENFSHQKQRAGIPGSPPRMRGKPAALDAENPEFGITPAHAGKTAGQRRQS